VHYAHATRRGRDRPGEEVVYLDARVAGWRGALLPDFPVRGEQAQLEGAGAGVDHDYGHGHPRTIARDIGGPSALSGAALGCVNEVDMIAKCERKEDAS